MDLREQIIQKIMQALDGRTDAGTADIVQDILIIELNNYEIQERCTDVALADDSADRMLKKFLATKRIEGIAVHMISGFIYHTAGRTPERSWGIGRWTGCGDAIPAFLAGCLQRG